MKLEIDIPSILYNDAKENRGYISVNKMEIAWKAIADGKPLEQETVSKESYDHEYFLRKEFEIKIAKLEQQKHILDKVREQIKDYLRGVEITLEVLVENDPLRPKMEGAKSTLEECLELIDKAESEDNNE